MLANFTLFIVCIITHQSEPDGGFQSSATNLIYFFLDTMTLITTILIFTSVLIRKSAAHQHANIFNKIEAVYRIPAQRQCHQNIFFISIILTLIFVLYLPCAIYLCVSRAPAKSNNSLFTNVAVVLMPLIYVELTVSQFILGNFIIFWYIYYVNRELDGWWRRAIDVVGMNT